MITRNYGEAGAVERYLPGMATFSGHNAYFDWGPPPDSARAAVFVGFPRERVEPWCSELTEAARIDNGVGLENDEQDVPVWTCRDLDHLLVGSVAAAASARLTDDVLKVRRGKGPTPLLAGQER